MRVACSVGDSNHLSWTLVFETKVGASFGRDAYSNWPRPPQFLKCFPLNLGYVPSGQSTSAYQILKYIKYMSNDMQWALAS